MSEEQAWWGHGPNEPQDVSWKNGSVAKRQRMAQYVEWLLLPASDRDPQTKTELAEQLGVTTATLRNYTKDPWLQRELGEKAREQAKIERLPEILQSLYDQATDRDNPRSVAAGKAYLAWLEKSEEARLPQDMKDMDNSSLKELTMELLARLNQGEKTA